LRGTHDQWHHDELSKERFGDAIKKDDGKVGQRFGHDQELNCAKDGRADNPHDDGRTGPSGQKVVFEDDHGQQKRKGGADAEPCELLRRVGQFFLEKI